MIKKRFVLQKKFKRHQRLFLLKNAISDFRENLFQEL